MGFISIRWRFVVVLLILLVELCSAQSTDQPKPLPPTFNLLTLEPGSGVPTIFWSAPPINPLYPPPTGYIIYKQIVDELGNIIPNEAIDTVPANQFTYTDHKSSGLNGQLRYALASNGPVDHSNLTTQHGSIYLTAKYDSCSNEIDLQWVHYFGWGNRIESYTVYLGQGRDWTDLPEVGTATGNQTTFSVKVDPNSEYLMYIKAKKTGEDVYTRSNSFAVNTRIARWPEYISIDSVIASNNQTDIYFTIDAQTELKNFALHRWSVPLEHSTVIFNERKLFEFTDPTVSSFTDGSDAWDARSRPFYFRVSSLDGCNRNATVSNVTNSIPLRVVTRGLNNTITWNKLHYSVTKPLQYKVYRIVYGDTEMPPEEIYQTSNPIDTTIVDNVSALEGLGLRTLFCYFVEARELGEGGNVVLLSRTRSVCTEVTPDIVMPTAIDPLSTIVSPTGGNPRNYFAPTISFRSDYTLTIYNRWGGIVFVGNNQGWNGYNIQGEPAKEGTYVYRLEVYPQNHRTIVKTGSVTVMYGPQ